jgi:hypothetical protein
MDSKLAKSKTDRLRVFCKKNGFALTIMLCAVVILLVTGVGVMSFGQHGRSLAVQTSSTMAARCSADAGLTKALYEMNEKLKDTPWDNTSLPEAINEILPNSDAIYSYSVTGDLSSGHVVKSIGKYGIRGRTVTCSLPLKGLFEYAIFGDEYIHLKNGGIIDWYNNDANDGSLQIGTNNILADSIVLKPGTTVNGDVVIGVGGDPDTVINDTGSNVTGNTYIMPQEYDLPQITVPEWLEAMPSGGTIKNSITINSSGKYDKIDLGNSKIMTIDGEVTLYIIGDIILDNSAELQILDKEDVSLILYVGGNIEVKNSGVINNLSGDATKLTIYGLETCESIILKNDTDFYGAIYAPNADIIMMNSGDVYGSVVGNSIDQKNSANFIYDASLKDVSVEDEGVRFVVQQWQEE